MGLLLTCRLLLEGRVGRGWGCRRLLLWALFGGLGCYWCRLGAWGVVLDEYIDSHFVADGRGR